MKNILIYGAIILLLIGAGVAGAWFYIHMFSSPAASVTQNVQFPVSGTATSTGGSQAQNKTAVVTSSGGVMQTNNFLANPSTGAYPTAGYYYLGYHAPLSNVPDTTATAHPPYVIEYVSQTQYFNISLLQEPLGAARTQAEQFLRAQLGISEAQMCQLQYMVSVPVSVSAEYAGESLGFSFCSGAVKLP